MHGLNTACAGTGEYLVNFGDVVLSKTALPGAVMVTAEHDPNMPAVGYIYTTENLSTYNLAVGDKCGFVILTMAVLKSPL